MALPLARSSLLRDPAALRPPPEDRIKLLRLESAFLRSCLCVRDRGSELQLLRAHLLQELFDLEVEKRKSVNKDSSEQIKKLQVGVCCVLVRFI